MTDLRCGDWRDVLADVECDALICDPPYGARTHQGHDKGTTLSGSGNPCERRELSYANWSPDDARSLVSHWAPRASGWMAIMSCSDLMPVYRAAFDEVGMVSFAPIPCVIRAMTVRLTGDGPSNWAVYLNVARRRNKQMATWGTLPGTYVVNRASGSHIGGKPIALMNAIIRDYSRPGDLVCDPCAGLATTALSCTSLGRRFVGSEIDPETHAKAIKRLSKGVTMDMFGGAA